MSLSVIRNKTKEIQEENTAPVCVSCRGCPGAADPSGSLLSTSEPAWGWWFQRGLDGREGWWLVLICTGADVYVLVWGEAKALCKSAVSIKSATTMMGLLFGESLAPFPLLGSCWEDVPSGSHHCDFSPFAQVSEISLFWFDLIFSLVCFFPLHLIMQLSDGTIKLFFKHCFFDLIISCHFLVFQLLNWSLGFRIR